MDLRLQIQMDEPVAARLMCPSLFPHRAGPADRHRDSLGNFKLNSTLRLYITFLLPTQVDIERGTVDLFGDEGGREEDVWNKN